jgi:glucose-1-phosphate cytidylyltransferase
MTKWSEEVDVKAVILAGGFGTRLSEETSVKPKPMVEIGGKPILWHIMKSYSVYGINDFIICCGYKGYMIKEYFSNYFLHNSDVTFSLKDNNVKVHNKRSEPWTITLVDTGEKTMTGGRLKRVKEYLDDGENFCMTYGDGLSNINIRELIKFHEHHGDSATVSVVYPPGRFGSVELDGEKVVQFNEKPKGDGALVNGGYFVLSTKVIDLIDGDDTVWEAEPMKNLAKSGQISSFLHEDFWQPMDTLRDKEYLEGLWETGNAPWKKW